jgi:hypothetical protein
MGLKDIYISEKGTNKCNRLPYLSDILWWRWRRLVGTKVHTSIIVRRKYSSNIILSVQSFSLDFRSITIGLIAYNNAELIIGYKNAELIIGYNNAELIIGYKNTELIISYNNAELIIGYKNAEL